MLKGWTRGEKLALLGLIVAAVAAVAAVLVVPEFRELAGLNSSTNTSPLALPPTPTSNSSPSSTNGETSTSNELASVASNKPTNTPNKNSESKTVAPTLNSNTQLNAALPRLTPSIVKPSDVNVSFLVEALDKGGEWAAFNNNYRVSLSASGKMLIGATNENGIVRFSSVPCGGQSIITVYDGSGEGWLFKRQITCSARNVNLGKLRADMPW